MHEQTWLPTVLPLTPTASHIEIHASSVQNVSLAALVPEEMGSTYMHILFEAVSSPYHPHTGAAEAAIPFHQALPQALP